MAGNDPDRDLDGVDYTNTFIAVSPDCAATEGTPPPGSGDRDPVKPPSISARTFDLITASPYVHTSGDVIFTVWADRRGIPEEDRAAARAEFYSKGQPCLRSSDLGKRYGWGVHADSNGRIALYGVDSAEYAALKEGRSPTDDAPLAITRAMRSSRH
ncbi:MAG: hypothetical protein JWQ43_3618 [Glaciihabitans sp.]|nr:hypothetical protein [Glaciihabitans sp.]